LLKVDIEGAEYEILHDIVALTGCLEALVIEFHQIDVHAAAIAAFAMRVRATHVVAHLHGNNFAPWCAEQEMPCSIEVVFVRGSAADYPEHGGDLPRAGLDSPNSAKRPDVVITRR
jgi:hypothetical protein